MGRKSRLIKNSIILFVGVIGTKLINFFMLPFYTRWLTVAEYGEIDIFTTVISVCAPIFSLQLEQAVFRYIIDDDVEEKYRITISTGIFGMILGLVCTNILSGFFFVYFGKERLGKYIFASDLQCCYIMVQQIARGQGNNRLYTINSIVLSVANCVCSVIFLGLLGLGVQGYVLVFGISYFIALGHLIYKTQIHKYISISNVRIKKLKQLLTYSIPMIVNNISWWVLNTSDRLILRHFVGIEANGIYAAAGKIPGLVITVFSVFHMAWLEVTSRESAEELSDFYTEVFRNLFGVVSYLVIGILVFGRVMFNVIMDDKFSEAYNHIPILTVALFFLCISQFYGGIYVGLKKSKELGYTSMIAALVNIVFNCALVEKVHIYAASLSTLIAYAVLLVVRLMLYKSTSTIKYNIKELLVTFVSMLVAFVISYSPSLIVSVPIFSIISTIFYLMYKDILNESFVILKHKLSR